MSSAEVHQGDVARPRDIVVALREATGRRDGPEISDHSLALLRDLLRVEWIHLHGLDSATERSFFHQRVGEDGDPNYLWMPNGAAEPRTELAPAVEEWMIEAEARLWERYRSGPVGYFERTGDWASAQRVDVIYQRSWVDPCRTSQRPQGHAVNLASSVGGRRQLQVVAVRDGRGSFSERELGLVELLMPHLTQTWCRFLQTSTPLTASQRRVLELVREGHTNRQVARNLGISEATVRTHLGNAFAALGVTNRVAAVAAAFGATEPVVPAQRREAG